jgi:hydrogenase expression/formation protein HypC
MCLAIPVKITKISGTLAHVNMSGVEREVDIRLIDKAKPGDYVLMHAGFAIEKINKKEAQQTLKMLKNIYWV